MILSLWVVLVSLSLVLIVIGLARPTESAQALIGFFLLFLLGFPILLGTLEYRTGDTTATNYTYTSGNLTSTSEAKVYTYATYQNHTYGFYLTLASAIGFILVLFGLRNTRRFNDG